mgnify:FL=1
MSNVAAVVDRLTGNIISRHRTYQAADIAACKMGERYGIVDLAAARSNADRQSAYRARKADVGKTEVRGIFATHENAEKIRRYAGKL